MRISGYIGAEENGMPPCRVVDAAGYAVTPGFLDVHRHCDYAAVSEPDFGEIELSQGLTGVFGGNCGLGIAPSGELWRQSQYDYVEPCLGAVPSHVAYSKFGEYMDALDRADCPLHVGCFLGMGAVRAAVKGYESAPFTGRQMEEAAFLIREGLEAGAAGISMGIMYQPECYSTEDEVVTLLRTAAPYGRVLTCHIRGEGNNLVSSLEEVIGYAQKAELALNISHFKVTGMKNWGRGLTEAIALLEKKRDEGMDITVDFYPYAGGSTTLLSLIPLTFLENTLEETIAKLEKREGRQKLFDEIYREHPGWDNMVTSIGWERIVISSVREVTYRGLCGLSMREAAQRCGYDDPCELLCELMLSEQGKVGIVLMSMSMEDVETIARLPYASLISDALYGKSDCPHPRLYGAFPEFLTGFVFQKKLLSLEEAVKKMTRMPAERLGLQKRGRLAEGYYADLNIFRPDELKAPATYEKPRQLSHGIYCTFVDGICVRKQDKWEERCRASTFRL